MPKIRFNKQFTQLEEKVDSIVGKAALAFYNDIVRAWPRDTGFSVGRWTLPEKIREAYIVTNNATYSPVLWRGRHSVNGKMYGSEQLPQGGVPILNSVLVRMRKELKGI